jgi:predicted ester cyclase
MSRISWTATHTGDLGELPATGKTGTVTVFAVFRLVNGKIAEEWEVMDELGLMTQLGMALKPKEAGK